MLLHVSAVAVINAPAVVQLPWQRGASHWGSMLVQELLLLLLLPPVLFLMVSCMLHLASTLLRANLKRQHDATVPQRRHFSYLWSKLLPACMHKL